jgi:hypothetical protein
VSRILIYDRFGTDPTEVLGVVSSMEWNDTDISEAKIKIPLADVNEDIIKMGNMVYIETKDIPEWGGVVMPPLAWRDDGVELTVKNPNFYLARRVPVKAFAKRHTTGYMAAKLIRGARKRGFMPIRAKDPHIDESGVKVRDVVREELTVLENLRQLAKAGGFEFWLDPVKHAGELYYEFNWQRRKRRRGGSIEIGGNAAWGNPAITLSGDVITVWHVTETEKQIGEGARVLLTAEEAKAEYGHWEGQLSVPTIDSGKERSAAFRRKAQDEGRPEERYRIQVEIGAGNKFVLSEQIRPGHIHWLYGPDYGFAEGVRGTKTRVRILHVGYKENQGYLDVVAQKWLGSEKKEWIP